MKDFIGSSFYASKMQPPIIKCSYDFEMALDKTSIQKNAYQASMHTASRLRFDNNV
jgi:hypothetical protein